MGAFRRTRGSRMNAERSEASEDAISRPMAMGHVATCEFKYSN